MTRPKGTVGKRPGRPGLWMRWAENGKRRLRRAVSDDPKAAREQLDGILEGLAAKNGAGPVTFDSFVADVWAPIHRGEVAASTLARSVRVIERFGDSHGARAVASITITDVRAWVAERRAAGVSPATLRREVTVLRPIFEAAVDAGLIVTNPVRVRIKGIRPRRTRLLRRGHLDEVLAAASPAYRGILTLIIDAGLRRGTAVDLRWRDVRDDLRALVPSDGANTKRKIPAVPLTRRCRSALRKIRAAQKPGEKRVFPHVTVNSLRLYWERLRERLGLPGWRLHDFRHQFASEALQAGAPHSVVADLLGHATPTLVVRTYGTSTATGAARAAMQGLERRRRGPRTPRPPATP